MSRKKTARPMNLEINPEADKVSDFADSDDSLDDPYMAQNKNILAPQKQSQEIIG